MTDDAPAPSLTPRKAASAWLILLLLGGGFALIVALLLAQRASPLSVAARLEQQPALTATMAAFRESYPDDYETWLAALAEIENRAGAEAADREATLRLRGFIAGKAAAIANAPVADLDALADANLAVLLRLREAGAPLCAAFLRDGAQGQRLPPAALAGVGQANALQFRAARGGEGPRRIVRGPLSETDGARWYLAIRTADPAVSQRINDESAGDGTDAERCATGIALYRAAASLPPELAANVTAHLVRQSFGRVDPSPTR